MNRSLFSRKVTPSGDLSPPPSLLSFSALPPPSLLDATPTLRLLIRQYCSLQIAERGRERGGWKERERESQREREREKGGEREKLGGGERER